MSLGKLSNPFVTWEELLAGLRDRFVAELGDGPKSAHAGEVLGSLAELGKRCNFLGKRLETL